MHAVTTVAPPFPIQGGRVLQVPVLKDNLVWLVICDATCDRRGGRWSARCGTGADGCRRARRAV